MADQRASSHRGQPAAPRRARKITPSLAISAQPNPPQPGRAASMWPPPTPLEPLPQDYGLKTSPLEFGDFSFMSPHGYIEENRIASNGNPLRTYLAGLYRISDIDFKDEFLVLEFRDEAHMPPPDERPFSIAGLIVIWKTPLQCPVYQISGEAGRGDPITLENDQIKHQLRSGDPVLEQDAVLYLKKHVFHDCNALVFLGDYILVELPPVDDDVFYEGLYDRPCDILNLGVNHGYNNGPLAQAGSARTSSLAVDETDYVQEDGKFYPGCMVTSLTSAGGRGSASFAGVLVRKKLETRLTCSFHSWQEQYDTSPDLFGGDDDAARDVFRADQGTDTGGHAGSTVGHLRERMSPSDVDIGLMKLSEGIRFDNMILDDGGRGSHSAPRARVLRPFRDLSFGDDYFVESFATGQQRVRFVGKRFGFRRDDASGDAYVSFRQGVCSTNTPLCQVDGLCGAALLRCNRRGANASEESVEQTVRRGDICGQVHHARFHTMYENKGNAAYRLLVDAMDPLIEGGWEVLSGDLVCQPRSKPDSQEKAHPRQSLWETIKPNAGCIPVKLSRRIPGYRTWRTTPAPTAGIDVHGAAMYPRRPPRRPGNGRNDQVSDSVDTKIKKVNQRLPFSSTDIGRRIFRSVKKFTRGPQMPITSKIHEEDVRIFEPESIHPPYEAH